jgi:hypothetical protein
MATEEMWQLREQFLREAFLKVGTPVEIQEKWLKIDEAFKKAIVKMSRSQCERRYTMDEIIDIPDPLCRVFGSPEFKKVA